MSAVIAATILAGCATAPRQSSFPAPASLPAQAALPDPLTMLDGRRVETREMWFSERRPELQALFQHYMYGAIPPRPAKTRATLLAEHRDFLGGQATLRLLSLDTGGAGAPRVDLMLVAPNRRTAPAAVFLAMNFCGNHALTTDPRVPLARGWLGANCKGCTNNAATDAARGTQAADWPLDEIIARGHALAVFYSGDVDADRKDVSDGLYAWLASGDPARNAPAHRGTIAGWAWGFHRCVDYLVTDRDIDARRIVAVGHSRNGKTALLATAFDDRISMAIPHQAGCGGTAPSRVAPELAALQKNGRPTAETVAIINRNFPHWFNERFKEFDAAVERLPFDQHCLVALCAPRPVLFTNAQDDQWANPSGQFEVLRAASPVYRLLGVEGLTGEKMPHQRHLIASRLGYYIREGRHAMQADDWRVYLDFAEAQWRAQ